MAKKQSSFNYETLVRFMLPQGILGYFETSMEEIIAAVAVAVDFYNNRRPHMSIGMMKPSEAQAMTGERDMKWISYRQMAIKNSNSTTISENLLPENSCQGFPSGLRPTVNP